MSTISSFLSWLPAWLTDGVSLLLWLAALGCGAVAVFAPITYRIPAIVLAGVLAAVGGWTGGFAAADAQCEAAAARARAAALEIQIDALTADAATRTTQAMNMQLFKGNADALVARTPDGACLSADVADGVRSLWP